MCFFNPPDRFSTLARRERIRITIRVDNISALIKHLYLTCDWTIAVVLHLSEVMTKVMNESHHYAPWQCDQTGQLFKLCYEQQ